VVAVTARHQEVIVSQTKTRQRVRDLAEVYTHEREVNAMLNLVPDMFPSIERPKDIGHTFLEPACGAGNFLVAILDRKLQYVKFGTTYRNAAAFEAATLKALASIYGIDIDAENVTQSRQFLKADIAHHMNEQMNTLPVSDGFWSAVDVILDTNIIRADTLKDAHRIRFVEYRWQRKTGFVIREWSYMQEPEPQFDLFDLTDNDCGQDEVAIHYSEFGHHLAPVKRNTSTGVAR